MRIVVNAISLCFVISTLTACGCACEDKAVVTSPTPVIVPSVIESHCKHGYDNETHSCY